MWIIVRKWRTHDLQTFTRLNGAIDLGAGEWYQSGGGLCLAGVQTDQHYQEQDSLVLSRSAVRVRSSALQSRLI